MRRVGTGLHCSVRFLLAVLVYLLMGLALGWGILHTMHGNPWYLLVALLIYGVAFARLGCLPGKHHGS